MSVKAVGAYLQTLREEQGLQVQAVATAAGTNPTYVWRIESGEIPSPGAKLLGSLVRAVNGSTDQLFDLLLDEHATVELGAQMARGWLKKSATQRDAAQLLDEYGPEILEILDELAKPKDIGEWLGYGRGLKRRPGAT